MHTVRERRIDVCVVSEPVIIPPAPRWFGSNNKRVGIYINTDSQAKVGYRLVRAGTYYVVVEFGNVHIMACYLPPSISHNEYAAALDAMGQICSDRTERLIVCGDFNARSLTWDSGLTNWRGELVEEWAALGELRLLNVGRNPTCIRQQGTSTIDLSWSTADLVGRLDWRILEVATLSDHVYVEMHMRVGGTSAPRLEDKRWNFKKMNTETFVEAIEWKCSEMTDARWSQLLAGQRVKWIRDTLFTACDESTPASNARPMRKKAHWWSEDIAKAREECTRAQRDWSRSKRRRNPEETARLNVVYKAKRKTLRRMIDAAKSESWRKLIASIDDNPWGLPYKLVLNKLRSLESDITLRMKHEDVLSLVEELFPTKDEALGYNDWSNFQWNDDDEITPGEVYRNIKKRQLANTAPGPDGVKTSVLKKIPDSMLDKIQECLTCCLREGVFPMEWKVANLVLIPKGEPNMGAVPKVRPICLLDDIGKIFERILADRILHWMNEHAVAQLSGSQFGFRKQRSTLDAIRRVAEETQESCEGASVTIAVCLDIKNAFNSLPWGRIREALKKKGLPDYLRRILDSYFSNRWIRFKTVEGRQSKKVTAGVPQGSVLGPLLWNVTYDEVLHTPLENRCKVIGYADDTIILATANNAASAAILAGIQTARVLLRINGLGLQVSENKTEVVIFHGRKTPEIIPPVVVGRSRITVGKKAKYLGVILDSRWSFEAHFEYMENKVSKVIRALGRLMPNLRGPDESKRRLYAHTLMSVALYGAPIWSGSLSASRKNGQIARRLFRLISIRVIAAYRSIAHDAATLLARIPPLNIIAEMYRKVFIRSRDLIAQGEWTKVKEREIKNMETVIMRRQWKLQLGGRETAGLRTVEAIVPQLDEWLDRSHGSLSFHLTQSLTGHGCFNTYLFRINKAESELCSQCGAGRDNAEHTLFRCESWNEDRNRAAIGLHMDEATFRNLSLRELVGIMLRREEDWKTITQFVETIMRRKEEEERFRQGQVRRAPRHFASSSDDSSV